MAETVRARNGGSNGPKVPRTGVVGPYARVWHIVLINKSKPLRPERLATFVLDPAEAERFGLLAVEQAVQQSRREWTRLAIDAGYTGDAGYRVDVVHEIGIVRSLFPGVGLASAEGGLP